MAEHHIPVKIKATTTPKWKRVLRKIGAVFAVVGLGAMIVLKAVFMKRRGG